MTSFEEAVNIVGSVLGGKENKIQWQVGYLGDGAGAVLTARENYLLVRYPYENSPAVPVYCGAPIAAVDGLRVIVGYLPWEPGRFQIITQSDQRIDAVGTTTGDATETPVSPGSTTGYSVNSAPHTANHQYLSVDPISVNWRQIAPLGVFPTYPASLTVQVRGGYIPRPGADIYVSDQTLDLTSYVPVAGALYALISFNSAGTPVVTAGAPNLGGFNALTSADMPDTPAGNWRSAAVVLYAGQTSVQESRSEIDIYDLRFPEETAAGTLDLSYGSIFVGNASNVATEVPMSGDATISPAGVVTIAQGAIDASNLALTNGSIFIGGADGLAHEQAVSGDASIINSGVLTLSTVNADVGTYGDDIHLAQITVDAKGRITAIGNILFSTAEVLMADGITPPDPLTTEDETDWLYEG